MKTLPLPYFHKIQELRHQLHQYPELSGKEHKTAERIAVFLHQFKPDKLLTGLGGTGIAAIFNSKNPEGPSVMFRAELDALPILETGAPAYKSQTEGVAHLCGHDGHMAILAGLAGLLHEKQLATGKVVLLFQPAEETGAGAKTILDDIRFTNLQPDYVFALHNLPGVPQHQVVICKHVFAAASTGMIIEFYGHSSHAAEPENGLNPGVAMSELILALNQIAQQKEQFKDLALLTVIHARLGEIAFGTNPGFATVMATLRAYLPQDLQLLKQLAQQAITTIAAKYNLKYKINYTEEFPATINHPEQVKLIQKAAHTLQLETHEAVHPFRWSEDFGHFTNKYKGALFGLGSGVDHPQLHHSGYDFPDEVIPTGANLFYSIAQQLLNI